MTDEREIEWVFDPTPPSGARRGGDPAGHAFQQDVDTFVREVIQNANDQADEAPRIRFRLVDLESDALQQFRAAVGWQTLEPHLRAASRATGGEFVRTFLDSTRDTLRIVIVEDHGTVGLTGEESDDASHFTALCKDTLYSHKRDENAAGGSYGLGKSVLWNFSGCSTVLFNSHPTELPNADVDVPRWIGRCELPSHKLDEQWFLGAGWHGDVADDDRGRRAVSVWGDRAAELANQTGLAREEGTGTSICIVGFREPTGDADIELDALGQRIWRASYRYFWPAMFLKHRRLRVEVEVDGELLRSPSEFRIVDPLRRCYRAANEGEGGELLEPGDIAVRHIRVELPSLADGTPTPDGHVTLAVRLAESGDDATHQGDVAMFRGAGMVVRYWSVRNVGADPRPFHATVIAGTARNPENPSPADRAVEAFLRDAEPPGHDEWTSTPKLPSRYRRGYATALKTLHDRIRSELRALLTDRSGPGKEGPERLRRRFPLSTGPGGGGSRESAFEFRSLDARFEDGCWEIEGEAQPVGASGPWSAELRLFAVGEDGKPAGQIALELLETNSIGGKVRKHDGTFTIEMDSGDPLVFLGASVPVVRTGAVMLEIHGRVE